jgi:hypothetical protein
MRSCCALQDLENSTGSWDMYGQDSDKRYPGMQAEFFERAGDVLKRREALRGFVALGERQHWVQQRLRQQQLWQQQQWTCRVEAGGRGGACMEVMALHEWRG